MTEKKEMLPQRSDWTLELINEYFHEVERIAKDYLKLDVYPNQIEIISAEQMMDAYSSVGMPIMYDHWSFGKSFIRNFENYERGAMGLAYEIVINSNPSRCYLMEENTLLMQILVLAHVQGHNAFFKNNYLFKQWTDASAIIPYCSFAKKYIAHCEEKYGIDEVEEVLDACHALQNYGVDRYPKPKPLSLDESAQRMQERNEFYRKHHNELWATIPKIEPKEATPVKFPEEPQENILYFLEKHAPHLETWKREIIRIVRKLAQYFYPQKQTKVSNEGFACVIGDTLIDTNQGLISAQDIVENKFNQKASGINNDNFITQWYFHPNKERVKITTKKGLVLHGGKDHKIFNNNTWYELQNLKIGDRVDVHVGNNNWGTEYITLPSTLQQYPRPTLVELCKKHNININTYYKWLNNTGVVLENKTNQCKKVFDEFTNSANIRQSDIDRQININIPSLLSEDLAYFLGAMIGDGGINNSNHYCVYFANGDREIIDKMYNLFQNLFNITPKIYNDPRGHWVLRVNSKQLALFLINEFDFNVGKAANIKTVPTQILKSPKSVVKCFVQGHFDTDGCCSHNQIILITKSEKLARTQQQILIKMGLFPSIRKQPSDGCYRLLISGSDVDLFNEYIQFGCSRKQQLVENSIQSNTRRLKKTYHDKIVSIEFDTGPVYDFGVENTHEYKAHGFLNHNCFTHYEIMHRLKEEGLIGDGFMLEFFDNHAGVVNQFDFDDPRYQYTGINVYALGFAIYKDIKRICLDPTDEDKEWFPNWAGCGDWVKITQWAAYNFKDESFIQQFLSPKVIRDLKLFSFVDDEHDDMYEISAIHNKQGYKRIRDILAKQYDISYIEPQIQIQEVDIRGDRSMTLHHTMVNGMRLAETDDIEEVMKHLAYLWGFDIHLHSVELNKDREPEIVETCTITSDKDDWFDSSMKLDTFDYTFDFDFDLFDDN